MVDNTIYTFNGWADIVDFESDETSVTLINSKGDKVVEYSYSRFTQEDFDRIRKSSTLLNKHNLKPGDKFKITGFLGDIFITCVLDSYFKVVMQHVSGQDSFATYTWDDFNNKMIMGEINSLIRS